MPALSMSAPIVSRREKVAMGPSKTRCVALGVALAAFVTVAAMFDPLSAMASPRAGGDRLIPASGLLPSASAANMPAVRNDRPPPPSHKAPHASATPLYRLCLPAAYNETLDRWWVGRLWPNNTLHVFELEVLRGGDGTPDVLSILAFIEDNTVRSFCARAWQPTPHCGARRQDLQQHGVAKKGWNLMAMADRYAGLVGGLRCRYAGGGSTKVRAVYFVERGTVLGMLLQCAPPLARCAAAAG